MNTNAVDAMTAIDYLEVSMPGGSTLLNIVLALVMFGVALGIRPATFKDIIMNPKSLMVGIACQVILLPALTLCLVILLGDNITPMMALGMILVSACPGGNISNFITSLSRGNSELSVSLTAFNTAICIFSTPLNFAFWGKLYINFIHNHNITSIPELQIPLGEIFQTIFIIMGIPLVLGIMCGQYFPKITKILQKPLQNLSILIFIIMVVFILKGNFPVFEKAIKYIFLVVFLHNLLALAIGFGTSTLLKLPYKDRRTLTVETGIQNSGMGLILLLNPNIFPDDPGSPWAANGGMLVITAWWGVWHIISGLTLAFLWRWRGRKETNEQ